MIITKFLSNKWNLFGLSALSYFIIGYMLETMGFTLSQMFMAYVLMYIGNFASYLYGMSKGIIQVTSKRPNFIKELDKMNEMIRKGENDKKNSKRKGKCKNHKCGCNE